MAWASIREGPQGAEIEDIFVKMEYYEDLADTPEQQDTVTRLKHLVKNEPTS